MHVVPKVLSMWSGEIESLEVDWVSWIVSGESAWISILSQVAGLSLSNLARVRSIKGLIGYV